jgi:predicted nucleic acid-binding protein
MARRSLILDTGAVIALIQNNRRARALLTVAQREGVDVVVPPVVVTQTIRGGAGDAAANRLLKSVFIPFVGERLARVAGHLLGASGLSDVADAQIVAEALRRAPSTIVTGDPDDMRQLADGLPGIRVISL